MSDQTRNVFPASQLRPPITVPPPDERLEVRARIVGDVGRHEVEGVARAWNRDAVQVWWTDSRRLTHIDWLPAADVQRLGTV